MQFRIQQTIFFIFLLAAILVLPSGVLAASKSGEGGAYRWTLKTVPDCVGKGKSFSIIFNAKDKNDSATISQLLMVSPVPSTQSCGLVVECEKTFSQSPITDTTIYTFQINTSGPETSISVTPQDDPGTVCFENPLTTITFWFLFDRAMGLALVVGLAIGPMFLLYGIFRFITAAGDAKKVSDAVNVIKYTLVGIVILLLARGIVAVIINIVLG